MNEKRADVWLQQVFPNLSRSKVQSLIEQGQFELRVRNNQWRKISKSSEKISVDHNSEQDVRLLPADELNYVSRGALKLQKAIESFAPGQVKNKVCLDIGLSTGGFSDYLLQQGAHKVLGVDVGKDQLHESLRGHSRLTAFDKVNAKEPIASEILDSFFGQEEPLFDVIVIDVSFISLAHIIPRLPSLIKPNGFIIALFKPQFEVGPKFLNKKGVVKDGERIEQVKEKIIEVFKQNKLNVKNSCLSPIEGENGNQEILLFIKPL